MSRRRAPPQPAWNNDWNSDVSLSKRTVAAPVPAHYGVHHNGPTTASHRQLAADISRHHKPAEVTWHRTEVMHYPAEPVTYYSSSGPEVGVSNGTSPTNSLAGALSRPRRQSDFQTDYTHRRAGIGRSQYYG